MSEHPGIVCQGVLPGVGGLTAFQLCAGHPLIAGLGDDSENVRALFIARRGITEEFSVKKMLKLIVRSLIKDDIHL